LLAANEALQAVLVERAQVENTLMKLSSAVEQTADAIFITDRRGVIEYVNPAFQALTRYREHDIVGHHARELKSGEHDEDFYKRLWETILAGEAFRAVFINRRRNGTLYHEEKTITPIRDSRGHITHFVSAGRDITERTRAEEQLRRSREELRSLAAHLQSVREDERTRIAREIHDDLGQGLTGLKIDLSRLAARLPKVDLINEARSMLALVDGAIRSVRRICTELRPGVLDDLGLMAAIDWQRQEFEARTNIRCQFNTDMVDIDLDRQVATAVFRILQETLTNVARHANATDVTIALKRCRDRLVLIVQDNGRGISEREIAGRTSLGLLGMRERAALLGGQFSIEGLPMRGTVVTLEVPLLLAVTAISGNDSQPARSSLFPPPEID
jgi:PAS domain S-box-containing protein